MREFIYTYPFLPSHLRASKAYPMFCQVAGEQKVYITPVLWAACLFLEENGSYAKSL